MSTEVVDDKSLESVEDTEFSDAFDAFAEGEVPVVSGDSESEGSVVLDEAGDSTGGVPAGGQAMPDEQGSDVAEADDEAGDFDPVRIQAQLKSMSGRLSASDRRVNELSEQLRQRDEALAKLRQGDGEGVSDVTESPDSDADQLEDDQIDGKQALAELAEDFPEIAAAIQHVAKPDPRLDQFEQWQQSQAVQSHVNAIAEVHPDFQEVGASQAFEGWINQQPSFLRDTYQHIRSQGDAGQVIEMLNQYKGQQSNGGRQPVNNSGARRVPVKSGRSVIPSGGADMNDYDSAWDEAAGS